MFGTSYFGQPYFAQGPPGEVVSAAPIIDFIVQTHDKDVIVIGGEAFAPTHVRRRSKDPIVIKGHR